MLRPLVRVAAVAAALFRSKNDLGITARGTTVAVLSGGNVDPALLATVLQTESYTK